MSADKIAELPINSAWDFESELKFILGSEVLAGANTLGDLRKLTDDVVGLHKKYTTPPSSVDAGWPSEEVFDDFRKLPEPFRRHFEKIEELISQVDGKDFVSWNEGHETCSDDGTFFIGDEFVPALNAIAREVLSLFNRSPASGDARLEAFRSSLFTRLNNYLCEMKENHDDSIYGFNEAWDIVKKCFDDFLALKSPQAVGEP